MNSPPKPPRVAPVPVPPRWRGLLECVLVTEAQLQRRVRALARRIAHDFSGCDLVVVTTAPGSKSQENCHRRGFELLYARAILVKHTPAEAPTRR